MRRRVCNVYKHVNSLTPVVLVLIGSKMMSVMLDGKDGYHYFNTCHY